MDSDANSLPADPAVVARLCAEAGESDLAGHLLSLDLPEADVKARLAWATEIRAAVATAGRVCREIDPQLADNFIRAGASPAHAKKQLFAAIIAAEGPEISTQNAQRSTEGGAAGAWDRVIAELNAGHGAGGN